MRDMTDYSRLVMYEQLPNGLRSLKWQVVRYVRGVRKHRTIPVSLDQIKKWFYGTDEAFVMLALGELVGEGKLLVHISRYSGQQAKFSVLDAGIEMLKTKTK